MFGLDQQCLFLFQAIHVCLAICLPLAEHLGIQLRVVVGTRAQRTAGQFRFDATRLHLLQGQVRAGAAAVGTCQRAVQMRQRLSGLDALAFLDQERLDDPSFGRLHDLDQGLRYQAAFGTGDDVELADRGPADEQGHQDGDGPQDDPARSIRLCCFEQAQRIVPLALCSAERAGGAGNGKMRGIGHGSGLLRVEPGPAPAGARPAARAGHHARPGGRCNPCAGPSAAHG